MAMRIAQVAPLFESVPPELYGGTERVVSWLTEGLVEAGHEVTLFAAGDSVTKARLVPGCDRALRLSNGSSDHVAQHLRMIEEVYRARASFDLIHFHVDYLHFPASSRSGVPHLTTLHGRLDLPELGPLYRTFSDEPVVSISDAQREPLPWANWKATVHHGLPCRPFRPHGGKGRYLAFLGRFSPEKGPTAAIEIAKRAGMPLKLAAKVDASDRRYFEEEVRPQLDHPLIEYVGEIGEGDKDAFLGEAAALLFPIDWPEPFGLAMIEAMACGTPVIARGRGSVPEVVDEGVTGFVADDVDAAVEAVKRLEEFDRRRCREQFERRFDVRRMVDAYVRLYREMVA